ncbi:MAG: flagellum-specific ATP synthase FliI [Treponema sp.]|nr:MAG: flagellum-specific ATP synthase FliI [Treponema sp.]
MIKIFDKYTDAVTEVDPIKYTGVVKRVSGLLIESEGPQAIIGEICQIIVDSKDKPVLCEVVGLDENTVKLMSYDRIEGIEIGSKVIASGEVLSVPVSENMLGRVVDCLGKVSDDKPEVYSPTKYSVLSSPPTPMERTPIKERIITGIRAIDGMLPVGKGQRMGIFSGSGVGKSTVLGMIARNTDADVNVIAFIGERGREVLDFINNDLGPEGLKKSVIVSATSDTAPLSRIRGAYTATTIAEYFRDKGKNVMLLFDSVTRFAKAQREIGLSANEPPATRGYPPSVFETLPKLLERSGTNQHGSITAFYTVLVDGDDLDEPISDAVRGIIDGHIVLSRKLSESGHYPAIDVLASISRLAKRVSGVQTNKAVQKMRRLLATYKESEDLILVGAYQQGTSPALDEAIEHYPAIVDFLLQDISEGSEIEETLQKLSEITGIEIPPEEAVSEGMGATKKFVSTSESADIYVSEKMKEEAELAAKELVNVK